MSVMLHISETITWLSFMVHLGKMIILDTDFSRVHRGVKGQKMVHNDKFFLSHSTSYEWYIIWLSFMVHMDKVISLDIFFSISKFWFSGLSGGWKGKKWPKMTKLFVCYTSYFRNHISYDLRLWYTCMYKRISPGILSFYFQNLAFWDH